MSFSKINFIIFSMLLTSSVFAAKPTIFDTDMAIDDWSALLFLALHPESRLIGVTANGAGETHCQPALENISKLLDLTSIGSVDFACGDDYPLDGFFAFPKPWREQANTLSGISLPDSLRTASNIHAVDLIHQLLSSENEAVTLVTTGSLTNISQWLQKYPEDKSKVDRVVIMGGAFDVPGNIIVPGFTDDHPNTQAEWNIFVDAKAAANVFSSGLPIEVVGLDVTNKVKVTKEFAHDFKQRTSTPASIFWDKVLDDNDWFIESGEYYFWDVLAALVAIDPSFCEGDFQSVEVTYAITSDPWQASSLRSIPATTSNNENRNHFDAEFTGITRVKGNNPTVKICRNTYAERAFATFTETLTKTPLAKQ